MPGIVSVTVHQNRQESDNKTKAYSSKTMQLGQTREDCEHIATHGKHGTMIGFSDKSMRLRYLSIHP